MPLSSLTQQELREDRMRLVDVKVSVPTDEQIAKAQEKAGNDLPVRAQIEFTLEPLSYRNSDDSNERGFVTVTKGGKNGLTVSEIAAVRRDGWLGIPAEKQLALPRGYTNRAPEKLSLPYQRFMHFATKAGIEFLVKGIDPGVPDSVADGQLWTPAIGSVVVTRRGYEDFPAGNDGETYQRWMTYFTAIDADYVALPREQREVRTVTRNDSEAAAPATTVRNSLDSDALRSAAEAAGLVGQSTASLSPERQAAIVSRAINDGIFEFAHPDVMAAADSGRLVEYLTEAGAVRVEDGRIS